MTEPSTADKVNATEPSTTTADKINATEPCKVDDLSNISLREFDLIKIQYTNYCDDWRHYDRQVWQVTYLSLAVNAFLLVQAFNNDILNFRILRGIIVASAALFTFVFLVALVKHRLHQQGKDMNIRRIESLMGEKWRTVIYDFTKTDVLKTVDKRYTFVELVLGKLRASGLLIWCVLIIVFVDLSILVGIVFWGW